MDKLLSGIEDVPKIAFEYCGRCKVKLDEYNKSEWWIFIKSESGQMYQVPICKTCEVNHSHGGKKVE